MRQGLRREARRARRHTHRPEAGLRRRLRRALAGVARCRAREARDLARGGPDVIGSHGGACTSVDGEDACAGYAEEPARGARPRLATLVRRALDEGDAPRRARARRVPRLRGGRFARRLLRERSGARGRRAARPRDDGRRADHASRRGSRGRARRWNDDARGGAHGSPRPPPCRRAALRCVWPSQEPGRARHRFSFLPRPRRPRRRRSSSVCGLLHREPIRSPRRRAFILGKRTSRSTWFATRCGGESARVWRLRCSRIARRREPSSRSICSRPLTFVCPKETFPSS